MNYNMIKVGLVVVYFGHLYWWWEIVAMESYNSYGSDMRFADDFDSSSSPIRWANREEE
jgi:hypothetical protein